MKKEEAIITWNGKDGKTKAVAFGQLYKALERYTVPKRTVASDLYKDVYSESISIRDEYDRDDYELFRPGEQLPSSAKGQIKLALKEYKRNGLIRNIFDLMGDFAAQGIEINHRVKKVENFYRKWFKIVEGSFVSERLGNYLARIANVVTMRTMGKITLSDVRKMNKTQSSLHDDLPPKVSRLIPHSYTFLNPCNLKVLGEELVPLIGPAALSFGVFIPPHIRSIVSKPVNDAHKKLVAKLPPYIVQKIKAGDSVIELEPDKIRSLYYKKDDWEVWATPMITGIFEDLQLLSKMKQADIAAMDGAISQIRVWKLGNLEHGILPSAAAIDKLANILINNVGGGIVDLIWGPDLEYVPTETNIHNFLGETKYTPTLNRIFASLGIPPMFSGASQQGSFTNNFIAIKTLIERLNYIRSLIIKFWEYEIRIVQQAMGFNEPATISFDRMTLNDEASVLTLMKDLADRNLLSMESLHEMIGVNPEIETVRLKREAKSRKNRRIPEKSGPFSTIEENMKKVLAASGHFSAEELGVELNEKGKSKSPKELESKLIKPVNTTNPKGVSGQGRPKTSKDRIKRKSKEVKPRRSVTRSFVNLLAWANTTYKDISDTFMPKYLKSCKKSNLRQLTTEEFNNFEKSKAAILCNLEPFQEVTENHILSLENVKSPPLFDKLYKGVLKNYSKKMGSQPTTDQSRFLICSAYALLNSENVTDETSDIDYSSPTL